MHTFSGPILLATDLSARGDRALDRAVLLARQLKTSIIALHVVESQARAMLTPPRPVAEREAQAQRTLLRDLEGLDVQIRVLVKNGDPVRALRQAADENGCCLIVAGVARDETLGRILLGTTVEKLVREAHQPVLVVKRRASRPYRNALVASDFSEGSRHALRAVLALLPVSGLTLFHAFDLPGNRKDDITAKGFQRTAEEAAAEFLEATPELHGRDKPRVQVAAGIPERVLTDYADQTNAELLVTGSHGSTGLTRTAIGSVADALIEKAPCDVLVVRQQVR
ncbi:universal stress protein [Bordetella genomosp. 9]|uniref:universal stress protein n=1 Tax=Bordetella genomosp. 9 TaxID=1416803 RepID=UPI000A29643D|nr:universal stress protein [Bordetella genomosp. 9]ARP91992.1 universal stress protein [Bordetella genomosp. 9]